MVVSPIPSGVSASIAVCRFCCVGGCSLVPVLVGCAGALLPVVAFLALVFWASYCLIAGVLRLGWPVCLCAWEPSLPCRCILSSCLCEFWQPGSGIPDSWC